MISVQCIGDAAAMLRQRQKPKPAISWPGLDGMEEEWRSILTMTMMTHTRQGLRCQGCGKLLAEKAASGTVIVCSRCKTRNEAD